MRSRIRTSEARSAAVTRSASPLYSIFKCCLKWCISSAPASRAMADIAGIKLPGFEGRFDTDVRQQPSDFGRKALPPRSNWKKRETAECPKPGSCSPKSGSFSLSAVFGDVHDLMLEDEQVR